MKIIPARHLPDVPGSKLGADDARLIVEQIFPGEFTSTSYDPAACTSTSTSADAGRSGAGLEVGGDVAGEAGGDVNDTDPA
ncbi:MAG: hypothetical protein QOI66_5482 [Myxococcales bacterium]|jgi:hypothetical protein|nr:hypothetical protein [Myxococcales bacterium]